MPSQQQDRGEVRSQTQPFLTTGRYPTGALLAVTFFYLMKNPSLLQKLRNEIISSFGLTENITLTELDSCEYLNFCILEGLRLGSVVPAVVRSASKDMVLPRGGGSDRQSPVLVPRGSTIIICIQALHLRTDLWGDDAECYNPDRWRTYRFDWNFLPFSKGRRLCIGREWLESFFGVLILITCSIRLEQLAMTQAKYIIARFLQQFDAIQSSNDECSMKRQTDITTRFVFDSKVRFHWAPIQPGSS